MAWRLRLSAERAGVTPGVTTMAPDRDSFGHGDHPCRRVSRFVGRNLSRQTAWKRPGAAETARKGEGRCAERAAGFSCLGLLVGAQSWTAASRLAHDERILEAIAEEDQKRIRSSAPRAVMALGRMIEDPKHRDHCRAVGMVLDRVHPSQTLHTTQVEHRHKHFI